MNKYQREKAKRMKKLNRLGVSQFDNKKLMKQYSLSDIDEVIEQLEKFKAWKESSTFKKIKEKLKRKMGECK